MGAEGTVKYWIPKGMFAAAMKYQDSQIQCEAALLAAVKWLAENPQVPDDTQVMEMVEAKKNFWGHFQIADWVRWGASEWQRRMFVKLEEEVKIPQTVNDIAMKAIASHSSPALVVDAVKAAYRAGVEDGRKNG